MPECCLCGKPLPPEGGAILFTDGNGVPHEVCAACEAKAALEGQAYEQREPSQEKEPEAEPEPAEESGKARPHFLNWTEIVVFGLIAVLVLIAFLTGGIRF